MTSEEFPSNYQQYKQDTNIFLQSLGFVAHECGYVRTRSKKKKTQNNDVTIKVDEIPIMANFIVDAFGKGRKGKTKVST